MAAKNNRHVSPQALLPIGALQKANLGLQAVKAVP